MTRPFAMQTNHENGCPILAASLLLAARVGKQAPQPGQQPNLLSGNREQKKQVSSQCRFTSNMGAPGLASETWESISVCSVILSTTRSGPQRAKGKRSEESAFPPRQSARKGVPHPSRSLIAEGWETTNLYSRVVDWKSEDSAPSSRRVDSRRKGGMRTGHGPARS